MADKTFEVGAYFDGAAGVYYTTDSTLEGLVVEADTPDTLSSEVMSVARELIRANHPEIKSGDDVDIELDVKGVSKQTLSLHIF